MNDENLAAIFRLVKAGYGTLQQVRYEMNAREVVQALYYEIFLNDYENAYVEKNK